MSDLFSSDLGSRPGLRAVLAAGSLLLAACGSTAAEPGPGSTAAGDQTRPSPSAETPAECSNAAELADWSLNRRVSQLLMGAVSSDQGTAAVNDAMSLVAKGRLGGVNFLGTNVAALRDSNIEQVVADAGDLPPLLAVDEEGGRVQRLSAATGSVPAAREQARTMSPDEVQQIGKRIGQTIAGLSLNMDFAPVVDVGTRAIGDRSYADNPAKVTKYAGAFAAGLRESDVIPTLKHFPGLGRATGNTDFEEATTPPFSELQQTDLIPYRELLSEEPVAVMFANAVVPGLTDGRPASLSPAAYDLLRNDLGFDGVAITDSLSAAAITKTMTVAEAAEAAIVAGADIALWDDIGQTRQIRNQLKEAVAADRLSIERINEAVERVLRLKGTDLCSGS